jgi:SAM-dependent methyltransferase
MANCNVTAEGLSEWFATPQGHYILVREQAYFDQTVSDIFGFNAAQLGSPALDFLQNSRIPFRFNGSHQAGSAVRLCQDDLPFACDSLDLLLMPHLLEFSEYPHQILREAQRVLVPEGHLLISGFNPNSLWGLRRALSNKSGTPWSGGFIPVRRLADWLSVLGFDVISVHFSGYAPPFSQNKWLKRCARMETVGERWWAGSGGVYYLHAVKRVHGVSLLKPQWKQGLVSRLLPVTPKMNNNGMQCSREDLHE